MRDDVFAPFRLDGRVAVITGAASGIGRAAAEVLAAAGARVMLGDVDEDGLGQTVAAIEADGGEALARRCDVSRRDEVDALVAAAGEAWSRLDVLCNVAGIPCDAMLRDVDDAELDRVMSINLKGTLYACQAAIPKLAERGGSIVNVASGAIDAPRPGFGVYAVSKAGVAMLSQVLALEVGPLGIRVNVIAPGATLTRFTTRRLDAAGGGAALEAFVEEMKRLSPLGRMGEPLDQAWQILYLASDASRFCTGQIWRANGGQVVPR
jgi:3-oxoacyl-[acyl-carrier protein] reductase